MRTPKHIETLEYGPGKALKTSDPGLTEIFREVRTIYAPADFPVVIQGETGTGKEGVARAIHWHSPRRTRPFVAVNCGAIPEGLVDSEFFGHERGAFSGAITTRKGHFEIANGGTLFLDEIAELPLGLQARLLRVLQEGEIVRVGSSKPAPVDVRVVAATNKDLKALVDEGKFRVDLYYRIAASVVHIPPLRERPSDIMMLARAFIEECRPNNSHGLRLQPLTAHILRAYSWPGNVRELQSAILVARARAAADNRKSISVQDIPPGVRASEQQPNLKNAQSLDQRLIQFLAEQTDASMMAAAAFVGIDYHAARRMVKHEKRNW
ncbi:sigma 54-interacting transcriptional regulator [bacterium]|nr:sigma 54-interacting transcriptional regulator [bacterium]